MNYCNNCDIAYEERNCPLCIATEKIEDLQKEIEDLQKEIENLTSSE